LLIAFAPIVAARFTAVPRLASDALDASTSRMWQFGQTAEAMSRSSEISSAHPASTAGSGEAAPFWFTFRKHPLAVVHGARPKLLRYVPRSDSAFGESIASTMAMVWPLPALADGSLYADTRSAGPRPATAAAAASGAAGAGALLGLVRASETQAGRPARGRGRAGLDPATA